MINGIDSEGFHVVNASPQILNYFQIKLRNMNASLQSNVFFRWVPSRSNWLAQENTEVC